MYRHMIWTFWNNLGGKLTEPSRCLRTRSEARTELPLSTGWSAHVGHRPVGGGSRWVSAGRAAHAYHETFESGSFTLSGLRSRTPNKPCLAIRPSSLRVRLQGRSDLVTDSSRLNHSLLLLGLQRRFIRSELGEGGGLAGFLFGFVFGQ